MSENSRAIFKKKNYNCFYKRTGQTKERCFKIPHLLVNIDFSDVNFKKTNLDYISILVKHFIKSIMALYLDQIAYLFLA